MEGNGEQVHDVLDLLKDQRDPAAVQKLVEQAIQSLQRDDNPKFWADLQAMLGAALSQSTQGRWTPELFVRVLAAYRSALTVYNPDQWPDLWTQTQCNVGITYLRAVSSGIGEARQHIEQAIAAYEMALPYASLDSGTWLRCLLEMANALSIAAEWRGTSAHIASARAYEAALTVVTRETSPEQWARLNLEIARNLERVGADETIERGIRAADNALLVLRAETDPRDWAEAHLLLGGFYRTRRRGNREENLERAIDSLDKALSVFTRDTALDPWYRAHYHRGPAWLFRKRGDHDDNLIHAMESLQIAIDLTNRDQAPESWASLQVALGQAFLERRSGDPVANVESAITVLEAGYAVLRPDTGVLSWKQASRMLGEAYLERRGGDLGDNVARAIAVLTALQKKLPEPDDPPVWAGSLVNLALAWKNNPQGDPQSNRATAIECLENALRVPADSWGSKDEWSATARTLCLLYKDEKAETFGKPRAFDRVATRESSWVEAKTDPLDMAGQAEEQVEALRQARDAGVKPHLDTGWHVPSLLNGEGQHLGRNLNQFLKTGKVIQRNAEQRGQLEAKRISLLLAIWAHVAEKYMAALRTVNLLKEIENDGRPFVLFLRGFGMRELSYPGITVGYGGGSEFAEGLEKHRLATKLDPIPLVWIANPVESGPVELQKVALVQGTKSAKSEVGFRIESGESWQRDVRTLIAAATCIVIHNPEMTPGVTAEVEVVKELGRLEDTFFYSPEKAATVFTDIGASFQSMTKERIAAIRETARGPNLQPGTLPAATCAWLEGSSRTYIEGQVRAISRWVKQLAKARSALSIDLELDGHYYLLANLFFLEALDRMPSALSACADALFFLGDERLQNATQLGGKYMKWAGQITSAWDRTNAIQDPLERLAETLRILEGDQPEVPPS